MRKVSPRFGETAIVPDAKLNVGQKSFRELLIVSMAIKRWREGTSGMKKALSYRFREEGRVIVNSRSVNRRKIRSEWFEFLSRETNGRRDSRILMCHTKGAKVACFLYSLALAFYGRGSHQGRTLPREYGKSIGRRVEQQVTQPFHYRQINNMSFLL